MANLFLGLDETFNVGSNANTNVFGQVGIEQVIVETGAVGLLVDQNIERVDLSANSNDYIYQQQGNRLLVSIDGALVATIPAQGDADGTQVVFADGSVFVTLAAGIMNFGGTAVPSSIADTVTPITIDTSVTTMAVPDPRNPVISLIAPVELSAVEQNGNNTGFVINGVSTADLSGYSVSNAGDVNGDGLDDLIVGADSDDPNGYSSGASFVVFGKTDGSAVELSSIEGGSAGFVINGVSAGDYSGFSVSNAGDVNGDGFADLIVGARYDEPNGSSSGASFVVFGKTDGSAVELSNIESGSGGFVINGVSAGDFSSFPVSNAGDVNGDGFDDLIVGAYFDDPNGDNSGTSFVIFGGQASSATVGTSGSDTLTGDINANQLVAGASPDILLGNGGADVLRGGAGDDILAISDLIFASLDGGTGIDTLRFDTPLDMDLRAISNNKISSIERIDLSADDGNSTLRFNITDLFNLSETQTASNTLAINGNAGDTIHLDNTSNGEPGAWVANAIIPGRYEFIAADAGVGVIGTVMIDVDLTINIIV